MDVLRARRDVREVEAGRDADDALLAALRHDGDDRARAVRRKRRLRAGRDLRRRPGGNLHRARAKRAGGRGGHRARLHIDAALECGVLVEDKRARAGLDDSADALQTPAERHRLAARDFDREPARRDRHVRARVLAEVKVLRAVGVRLEGGAVEGDDVEVVVVHEEAVRHDRLAAVQVQRGE